LHDQWFEAPDLEAQKKGAAEIQIEAFKELPYIPTGQFVIPTAFRKNLKGVIVAPILFLWNVEKG
ncbi:MAG: ABC transporter substrate-binding protein, partial [Alphaproteobacteria bacterium]